MKIVIIHLDLGIGGAERLVVNIALCLKRMGHDVKIFTSHHDPSHCFEETAPGGLLHGNVHVIGGWIPHRLFFGRFTALMAILRVFYMALYLLCRPHEYPECVFLDGVSAPTPLLYFANIPVLFYCHFPDLLLCVDRSSWLKRAYRFVIDTVEEYTLGCADILFVNSLYTSSVVQKVFPKMYNFGPPIVLYPTLEVAKPPNLPTASMTPTSTTDITPVKDDMGSEETSPNPNLADSTPGDPSRKQMSGSPESTRSGTSAFVPQLVHAAYMQGYDFVFVSLNRYERKKRVEVALEAFAHLKKTLSQKGYLSSALSSSSSSPRRRMIQLVPNTFLQVPAVAELTHSLKFDALEGLLQGELPADMDASTVAPFHQESLLVHGCNSNFYGRLSNLFAEEDLSLAIANARILLVVAGGYDTNVTENIQYLKELKSYSSNLGLCYVEKVEDCGTNVSGSGAVDVVFRTSISSDERLELLRNATALLYTPENEHFGIVPLEAMHERCPVIAVASGGPIETVSAGETGFLCEQTAEAFSTAMLTTMLPITINTKLSEGLSDSVVVPLSHALGVLGNMRVLQHFTSNQMEQTLSRALRMFMHRLLPAKSRRQSISMIQNEVERDQLWGNIHRSSYYARCVLLFTISVTVVFVAFLLYMLFR